MRFAAFDSKRNIRFFAVFPFYSDSLPCIEVLHFEIADCVSVTKREGKVKQIPQGRSNGRDCRRAVHCGSPHVAGAMAGLKVNVSCEQRVPLMETSGASRVPAAGAVASAGSHRASF